MLPEAAGRGQHFQARSHSFSLYRPTLRRPITSFSSCRKLAFKFLSRVCFATLPLARLTRRLQAIRKMEQVIEQVNQISVVYEKDVLKNRFISNYVMLVHLVP